MNIRDLRDLISGLPDDMPVMISAECKLDGEIFVSPCLSRSDINELDFEEDEGEIISCLCLAPCAPLPEEEVLVECN